MIQAKNHRSNKFQNYKLVRGGVSIGKRAMKLKEVNLGSYDMLNDTHMLVAKTKDVEDMVESQV